MEDFIDQTLHRPVDWVETQSSESTHFCSTIMRQATWCFLFRYLYPTAVNTLDALLQIKRYVIIICASFCYPCPNKKRKK